MAQSFSLALELAGSGRGEELDDAEEMPEVDINRNAPRKTRRSMFAVFEGLIDMEPAEEVSKINRHLATLCDESIRKEKDNTTNYSAKRLLPERKAKRKRTGIRNLRNCTGCELLSKVRLVQAQGIAL